MQRIVEPEILDSLAPDHPAALHNRRDLRVVNRAMGNFRWFGRILPRLVRPGEGLLELGAGTGDLGRILQARGMAAAAIDLWPPPPDWPADHPWHVADLCAFDGYARYPVIIGNLIFHQFDDGALQALGRTLRQTARVICASEPARRRSHQVLYAAAAPLFGANYVSRHDGRASIAAGFLGDELPRLLGLDSAAWNIQCSTTLLGAYRMLAVRILDSGSSRSGRPPQRTLRSL